MCRIYGDKPNRRWYVRLCYRVRGLRGARVYFTDLNQIPSVGCYAGYKR